jgi:glycosyltransferase involved in cell wall biosynthesis
VGGDAVEYADPLDAASIAEAVRRLLCSPERRAALGVAAQERAALFDWQRTAGTVLEVMRQAAS